MIRVVLDANQFISALLKPGSLPDTVMGLVRNDQALLLLSEPICAEIERVIFYPKIRSRLTATDDDIHCFLARIRAVAEITSGTVTLPPLSADPDDTKYLECAVEGGADFIISGDRHLTDLKTFRGIRIATPAEFLNLINLEK